MGKLPGFSLQDGVKLAIMAKQHEMTVWSRDNMFKPYAYVLKVEKESGNVKIGVGKELDPTKLANGIRRNFEGGTRTVHVSDLLYDEPKR